MHYSMKWLRSRALDSAGYSDQESSTAWVTLGTLSLLGAWFAAWGHRQQGCWEDSRSSYVHHSAQWLAVNYPWCRLTVVEYSTLNNIRHILKQEVAWQKPRR